MLLICNRFLFLEEEFKILYWLIGVCGIVLSFREF